MLHDFCLKDMFLAIYSKFSSNQFISKFGEIILIQFNFVVFLGFFSTENMYFDVELNNNIFKA